MKPETLIYQKVRDIIPEKSTKTVFYCGITNTSQETFFYAFIDDEPIQCYTLAEQYELDENELGEVFSEIVDIIKNSKNYVKDKYNVATIVVDKSGIKMNIEYYDMNESEYRIQKRWRKENIEN